MNYPTSTLVPKVAIYTRVSTTMQAEEGLSLDAQSSTLSKYCEERKWEVYKIYTDKGISGKTNNRPQFQEMMADAKEKKFDIVLIWKLTRFSRNICNLLNDCEFLEKLGINLISYSESFDCSTPSGRLMRNVLGVIAEFEREVISENIKEALQYRASQGKRVASNIIGYDVVLGNDYYIVNEREAEIVKFIFLSYIEVQNFSEVARRCNSHGYKSKRAERFHPNSICVILTRPIYAGYILYRNQLIPSGSPAIIEKGTFNEVQRIIESRQTRRATKRMIMLE